MLARSWVEVLRRILLFLILVGVVFLCIAPFTMIGLLRDYLPQVYNLITGGDGEPQITPKPGFVNATRYFDQNLCRTFVTPNDASVVELKNSILAGKPVITPNWVAIRDWVGTNVQYKSDSEVHGENEFWQFPNETIPLRTGDCEDFSLLLCSLLRADGWPTDRVYVIVGVNAAAQYHAWVRVTWEGITYNIEPTANGFAVATGDVLGLSGFNVLCYFNDERFGKFT